jgi:hypothetical protein
MSGLTKFWIYTAIEVAILIGLMPQLIFVAWAVLLVMGSASFLFRVHVVDGRSFLPVVGRRWASSKQLPPLWRPPIKKEVAATGRKKPGTASMFRGSRA